MTHALIGLGSNLGDRSAQLDEAIERICGNPQITWLAQSSYHQKTAIGGPSGQTPFLNAALRVDTPLGPEALLRWIQQIENEMGRERLVRWGPRGIDLDFLMLGAHEIRSPHLVIPHPRMTFRPFVLEPAVEIAAEMVHRPSGWTLAELLRHLRESPKVLAVFGSPRLHVTQLVQQATGACGARALSDSLDPNLIGSAIDCRSDWMESQLEFLLRRCRLLKEESVVDLASFLISDFWVLENLALAEARLVGAELEEFFLRFDEAINDLPVPKLKILVDATREPTSESLKAVGLQLAAEDVPRWERYEQRLREHAHARLQGPLLDLCDVDPETAATEIVAAVEAMSEL